VLTAWSLIRGEVCVAVRCTLLKRAAVLMAWKIMCVKICVAVCVAVFCSVLQGVARVLQFVSVYCSADE